ncbi:MAG: SH3 domain-containing protein, partial [Eubacteriales bacterium]|nr:SH3 domain-containing protein [Eubacteriales bacterium]
MKKMLALLTALALLLAGSTAGAAAPMTAVTGSLGGALDRVKLRAAPSTGAGVLGQYFTGVRVDVLETGSTWWRVCIGDREGYMMSRFLSTKADAEAAEGIPGMRCTPYVTVPPLLYNSPDGDASVIATMDTYAITVLATVGMDWLQVRYQAAGTQPVTGYAKSDEIAMAENYAGPLVNTGDVKNRLNLREAPDSAATSLGRYYCGVTMCRLFDDHPNG